MATAKKKATLAEKFIRSVKWIEFPTPATDRYVEDTIRVDERLVPILKSMLPAGADIGRELAAHYQKALLVFGHPTNEVAQMEIFLGPDKFAVFFLTFKADIYVSAVQGLPFWAD